MLIRGFFIFALFFSFIFLQGCATSKEIYLPNGAKGYSVKCGSSALSMADCFEKAAEMCQEKGYYIYREGNYYQGNVSSSYSGTRGRVDVMSSHNRYASTGYGSASLFSEAFFGSSPVIDRHMIIACGKAPDEAKALK